MYRMSASISSWNQISLLCMPGFPRSWKVLDFYGYNLQILESPEKWVLSWKFEYKVLEFSML